jgi:hypothetical protein
MPEPLGRKSLPTIDSRIDDLPVDCDPTTTIYGSSIMFLTLIALKASCNFITIGISLSIDIFIFGFGYCSKIEFIL